MEIYIQYLCNGGNELLKRMAEVMREQMKHCWMKGPVGELRTERMTSVGEVTNEEIRQRQWMGYKRLVERNQWKGRPQNIHKMERNNWRSKWNLWWQVCCLNHFIQLYNNNLNLNDRKKFRGKIPNVRYVKSKMKIWNISCHGVQYTVKRGTKV